MNVNNKREPIIETFSQQGSQFQAKVTVQGRSYQIIVNLKKGTEMTGDSAQQKLLSIATQVDELAKQLKLEPNQHLKITKNKVSVLKDNNQEDITPPVTEKVRTSIDSIFQQLNNNQINNPPAQKVDAPKKVAEKTKLDHVIDEILTTEKSYNKNISEFLERLNTIEKSIDKLPEKQQEQVRDFIKDAKAALEPIKKQSDELIKNLEEAGGNPQLVDSAITKISSQAYQKVPALIGRFNKLTSELSKDKTFNTMFTIGAQATGSYLIQPIQRFPRYELLMKEVNKSEKVEAALQHATTECAKLNASIKEEDRNAFLATPYSKDNGAAILHLLKEGHALLKPPISKEQALLIEKRLGELIEAGVRYHETKPHLFFSSAQKAAEGALRESLQKEYQECATILREAKLYREMEEVDS